MHLESITRGVQSTEINIKDDINDYMTLTNPGCIDDNIYVVIIMILLDFFMKK